MTRYHLDTAFLIDLQRGDPKAGRFRDQILEGQHQLSIDPIVETEFFAGRQVTRQAELLFRSIERLAERVELGQSVCRQAAAWLSRMDDNMRKKHLADALIVAAATSQGAIVLSSDRRIERVFAIQVETY